MKMEHNFYTTVLAIVAVVLQQCAAHKASQLPDDPICTNIPPGFDQLKLGVDITKLDLFPSVARQDAGFRNTILDFTCRNGSTWQYTLPNGTQITYQLPDQISSAMAIDRQYLNYDSSNYLTYHQYQDQLNHDADDDKDFVLGAFTSSTSYQAMQTAQQQSLMDSSFAQTIPPGVVGQMQPYWGLSPSQVAQRFIDTILPDEYEDDPDSYNQLISTYGTHYISKGELGGIFSQRYSYPDQFRQSFGIDRITANIEASFDAELVAYGAVLNASGPIDPAFQKVSASQLIYFGGVGSFLTSKTFSAWWQSVPQSPWLVGVNLTPIYRLVYNNTKKQASVKRAILSYVDQAHLADLQRALGTFIRRTARGQPYAQTLQANVTTLLQSIANNSTATLDHEAVVKVSRNVKSFLQPLTSIDEIKAQTSLQITTRWDNKWPVTRSAGDTVADACGETTMQFGVTFPSSATESVFLDNILINHTYALATSPTTLNETAARNGQLTEPLNHCRLPTYNDDGNILSQTVTWSLQMAPSTPGYLQNVQLCTVANFNKPPFTNTTPIQSCAYPNDQTTPVPITFVWQDRQPAMSWSWTLQFGDMGPY